METIELGNDRMGERRKEGTTERGNDWNDTTSALNLVIFMDKLEFIFFLVGLK